MTIACGEKIPVVLLKQLTQSGLQDLSTGSVFNGKKVVLFGVPGAFTPTCTAKHLPGYVQQRAAFADMGIDIACMAVNDAFVMKRWAESANADGIRMLADGNAAFARALGLEMDGTAYGMGIRCHRFALYAENGIARIVAVEKPGAFDVSGAEAMLTAIKNRAV